MSTAALFISNLSMLGFDPIKHATGALSNIQFDEEMFTRNADNNKEFVATSYFLFQLLDRTRARKTFKNCWPITDYRRHLREYRVVAFRWLHELLRAGCLVGQIVLRRSFFEDCRGERINDIMASLSSHVIETVLSCDKDKSEASRMISSNALSQFTTVEEKQHMLESEIDRLSSELKIERSGKQAYSEERISITNGLHMDVGTAGEGRPKSTFSTPNKDVKEWNTTYSVVHKLERSLEYLMKHNCILSQAVVDRLGVRPSMANKEEENMYTRLITELDMTNEQNEDENLTQQTMSGRSPSRYLELRQLH
ncbi:hypothetical protein DFQ28_004201 [Apophysomyces sp. BC1034]|nr:hypothetical protein DFQ29_003402 [Apophysomyces sp. BC1021]KAG0188891.1 hypothetical protein DFQ28_004201 [Apophysomyces sp. BC1034]